MADNQRLDVGAVEATLTNVTLPMGLKVDSVTISGEGLHLETEPFAISLATPGKFEVFVSEASLTQFLSTKMPPNFRNLSVKASNGALLVRGSVVMLLEIPAAAICTLRIADSKALFVDLKEVNVLGSGATNLVQSQLDKINPILDVDQFPIRATMDSVEVVEGGVRLSGTAAPPSA